jgi:hypothetical protein
MRPVNMLLCILGYRDILYWSWLMVFFDCYWESMYWYSLTVLI